MNKCKACKMINNKPSYCKYNAKYDGYCGYHKHLNLDKKNNINIIEYNRCNKISKQYIIEQLDFYKINRKNLKTKLELFELLKNTINKLEYYKQYLYQIVKIQSIIRRFCVKNNIYYRGFCYYNKKICNNQNDFYTFDPCTSIPDKYFFSYKDNDSFYYGFDIRSLNILISNNITNNPYNKTIINKNIIDNLNHIITIFQKSNISIEYDFDLHLSLEQQYNQKVLSIFQKIDELNYYTKTDWFDNLSIKQLKQFYRELEDIWNYRANLSEYDKKQILSDKKIFTNPIKKIAKINDLSKLRNIILDDIDILISSGISKDNRSLGALYILSSLVIVSDECSQAMPYLIQNF